MHEESLVMSDGLFTPCGVTGLCGTEPVTTACRPCKVTVVYKVHLKDFLRHVTHRGYLRICIKDCQGSWYKPLQRNLVEHIELVAPLS